MVINIQNNDCFFLMDVPDLEVTDLTEDVQVTIKAKPSQEVIFDSKYTPVDGAVSISNVSSILGPYMNVTNITADMTENESVIMSLEFLFSITSGSITNDMNVIIYRSRMKMNTTPAEYHLFLSQYHSVETNAARSEFASFVNHNSEYDYKIGVAYINNGHDDYKVIASSAMQVNFSTITVNASPEKVANRANVDVDSLIYYDVFLIHQGVEIDKIRYNMTRVSCRNEVNFIYRNAFGLPENFTATGFVENTPELVGEMAVMMSESRRINAQLKDRIKVNTGKLNDEKFSALKSMALSDKLIAYDANGSRDVIIDKIDMIREWPSNKVQSAEITYLPTDDNVMEFCRKSLIKPGIFDKTFDHTFD